MIFFASYAVLMCRELEFVCSHCQPSLNVRMLWKHLFYNNTRHTLNGITNMCNNNGNGIAKKGLHSLFSFMLHFFTRDTLHLSPNCFLLCNSVLCLPVSKPTSCCVAYLLCAYKKGDEYTTTTKK